MLLGLFQTENQGIIKNDCIAVKIHVEFYGFLCIIEVAETI